MLTEAQKIQIRRHLGYPAVGNPTVSPGGGTLASGFQGWRWHQVSGALEWRMSNLQPIEESVITGLFTGDVTVRGEVSGAGLTVSIDIEDLIDAFIETVSYTTTAADDVFSVGVELANAIVANVVLAEAGYNAVSPLTTGAFSQAAKPPATVQPFPGIQITGPNQFTLVVTSDSPLILTAQPLSGSPQDPVADIADNFGNVTTQRGFLKILGVLQGAIATSSENLDTSKADVWTARPDEVNARAHLYNHWRDRLSRFLDIPLWENTEYGAVNKYGQRGGHRLIA